MISPYKSQSGLTRLWRAFGYSIKGMRAAFRHEAAFRQELLLAVVLAPCAFWVGDTPGEILLLLASLAGVLLVELINSAIEALADAISVEEHLLLGRAKDLGSAAVLLALCLAAGIWLTLLFF